MKLAANLQEQVASHLRRRILSGQLLPGTPLREQTLAVEFGISRGPIRDALLHLTKEGLLIARPNVGVRVANEPSGFKRNVIVHLRREIEASAISAWFETKDPALLKQLDDNLALYKEACGGSDLGQVVELDMAFHRLLVEGADNGSLVDLWLPIMLRMFLRYSRHRDLMESYHEHAGIVRAMHARHEWEALEALKLHIV
ncbi:MAG TPA: GntR family transcriptional regulator [Opitutaceae bacterium]|nr:GntR family transcriptional regulator [Opitutaceae bacterium]